MADVDLCYAEATALALMIREREVSPVEVVEAVLARIEAVNPSVNAYCTVTADLARDAAKEAEAAVMRGDSLGPLHGVPVGVKDVMLTKGVRTTFGCPIYADYVPEVDEVVVARLKAAGAIMVGKTNTPELAAGIDTINPIFGVTRNPWNLDRTAGGSSGGSAAALAAGMAPIALGSDHGGSLRTPAGHCGVVGFRTSPGRVPQYPSNWLYDPFAVTGPMARTVPDAALMLSAIAGPDVNVPISLSEPGSTFLSAAEGDVAGWRIGWSPDLGIAPMEPEIVRVCEQSLDVWRSLGCEVEEAQPGFDDVREVLTPLRAMRTAAVHQDLLREGENIANQFLRDFMRKAGNLGAMDVGRAEALRSQLWERCMAFFSKYDLLVTPTTQTPPFVAGEYYPKVIAGRPVENTVEAFIITYALSMTGLPVISIPCGFTDDGLPVGIQIAGRWRDDAQVLRAAAAFERAKPWAHLRPNLGA